MSEQFYDLSVEQQTDGTIRLEQADYCGESVIIDLHPEQVRFIARRVAGMKPDTAAIVADLERRLEVLADKIGAFVCEHTIREEIIERCGSGFELMVRLDALYDLALEFTGRLAPESALSASPQCVRNASAPKADKSPTPKTTSNSRAQLGLEV